MTQRPLADYFAKLCPPDEELDERTRNLHRWTHLGGAYCLFSFLKESDDETASEALADVHSLREHLEPIVRSLVTGGLSPLNPLDPDLAEDLVATAIFGALHLGLILKGKNTTDFGLAVEEINEAFPGSIIRSPNMSDDFVKKELEEILSGNVTRVSALNLSVGQLRKIVKSAALGGVTAVEVVDTGHPVSFRISISQLRSLLDGALKDAKDDDQIDLGLPSLPGQQLH